RPALPGDGRPAERAWRGRNAFASAGRLDRAGGLRSAGHHGPAQDGRLTPLSSRARGPLIVTEVATKAQMARFIRLPMTLNAADPAWIPPLISERQAALSAKSNPFFD